MSDELITSAGQLDKQVLTDADGLGIVPTIQTTILEEVMKAWETV